MEKKQISRSGETRVGRASSAAMSARSHL
jgi:hypothetical protein